MLRESSRLRGRTSSRKEFDVPVMQPSGQIQHVITPLLGALQNLNPLGRDSLEAMIRAGKQRSVRVNNDEDRARAHNIARPDHATPCKSRHGVA